MATDSGRRQRTGSHGRLTRSRTARRHAGTAAVGGSNSSSRHAAIRYAQRFARSRSIVVWESCCWPATSSRRCAETPRPRLAPARPSCRKPGILVIAHRGDSKVAPENTLPAFASAVKAGADLVELDYYHSADGVPVVFHDDDLGSHDRRHAAVGRREDQARQQEPGRARSSSTPASWFEPKFAGTRIPTLDEALDTIQAGSMTLIERKGGDPATCIELLKQKKPARSRRRASLRLGVS